MKHNIPTRSDYDPPSDWFWIIGLMVLTYGSLPLSSNHGSASVQGHRPSTAASISQLEARIAANRQARKNQRSGAIGTVFDVDEDLYLRLDQAGRPVVYDHKPQ